MILVVISYRQAISNDDRIKSGLDFLYDAPPGFNKGKFVLILVNMLTVNMIAVNSSPELDN